MLGSRGWIDYSNVPGLFDWIIGVLGVLAFVATAVQLWRTSNALEAAQQSYEDTRAEFAKAQTIREITLLGQHVERLAAGAHQTDRADAEFHLVTFVDIGSRIVSLLELSDLTGILGTDLADVLDDVQSARHRLLQAPEPTTSNYEQIGATILEMERVVVLLNTWSTTLQHTKPRSAARRKARSK